VTSHDHTHQPVEPAPPAEPGSGLTGYAIAKYGFILLIVIAILVFLALVVIPAITD
jgi:hypothetical protein